MITEDYVSFELAKLLKDKGFYGECFSMYLTPKPYCGMGNPNKPKIALHGRDSHYYEGYLYQCEAPTHQMACKWLREEHNLTICINFSYVFNSYTYSIKYITIYKLVYAGTAKSYEEAVELALKYVLENLI